MIKKSLFLLLFFVCLSHVEAQNVDSKTDTTSLFGKIEHWYRNNMNYASITLLMVAESSILPVPSELVIPPAAYIASDPNNEKNLKMFWVIFFGTIGALIGSILNYFILGKLIGRPILYKFADSKIGKFFLLNSQKLQKTENYFNQYGKISTFIARFIPVVRHLISIPAGFAKMNFPMFVLFTFLGAGLWNCCLAALGYFAHGQSDAISKYSHELSYAIIGITALGILYWIGKYFYKKRKRAKS